MNTHRVQTHTCPQCATHLDMAQGLTSDTAKPKPHDITVCAHCGATLRFNPDMSVRTLSAREWVHLSARQKDAIFLAKTLVLDSKQTAEGD